MLPDQAFLYKGGHYITFIDAIAYSDAKFPNGPGDTSSNRTRFLGNESTKNGDRLAHWFTTDRVNNYARRSLLFRNRGCTRFDLSQPGSLTNAIAVTVKIATTLSENQAGVGNISISSLQVNNPTLRNTE